MAFLLKWYLLYLYTISMQLCLQAKLHIKIHQRKNPRHIAKYNAKNNFPRTCHITRFFGVFTWPKEDIITFLWLNISKRKHGKAKMRHICSFWQCDVTSPVFWRCGISCTGNVFWRCDISPCQYPKASLKTMANVSSSTRNFLDETIAALEG